MGNFAGKFGKIGFKLDVREVLKQCDRAGGFKVLTRVNVTRETLIREILEWRDNIANGGYAPFLWDKEKPRWVWMPEDGSTVDMGPAAEPEAIRPGLRLPTGNKKHACRAPKRNVSDRMAPPKKAKAALEAPMDLQPWLDNELSTEEDRKEEGEEDDVEL